MRSTTLEDLSDNLLDLVSLLVDLIRIQFGKRLNSSKLQIKKLLFQGFQEHLSSEWQCEQ